jgi:hypothetical protein
MSATILLNSGGAVVLERPFIFGNGIAGDIAGETRWFADADIAEVIER